MRIMPVGDSMTVGCAGDHTWRSLLWRHLSSTDPGVFRFVGPRTTLHEESREYADPAFPEAARGHLSAWGHGWIHHAPVIHDVTRAYRPDVLLVSLGLIDLGFYTDADQTAANVRLFLSEARRAQRRLRFVLLPVLPNVRVTTDPAFAGQVDRFNTLLGALAAEGSTPESPLLLASVPGGWHHPRDTHDGTHPSLSGEQRMAAAFADAMHQAWGIGHGYPLGRAAAVTAPVP